MLDRQTANKQLDCRLQMRRELITATATPTPPTTATTLSVQNPKIPKTNLKQTHTKNRCLLMCEAMTSLIENNIKKKFYQIG